MAATSAEKDIITLESADGWTKGLPFMGNLKTRAMKISAVNACVETISNSMSKLPAFAMDKKTRKRVDHPLTRLLNERPNEAMAPSVFKKLVEVNRLCNGNAYILIFRSARTGALQELIPLQPECVMPYIDYDGRLWFIYTNPRTGEMRKLHPADVMHLMAYSNDGINGISVLERAKETIATAEAAQTYEKKVYENNNRPSGVLKIQSSLDKGAKDKVREEWANIHEGADNAFRVAVLDLGMEYQPISLSNKDTQFVESKSVTVEDIARFFTVPLYKINAGKQSYSSNEQNGIEYVVNTIHPVSAQYEEEYTYKGLFLSEREKGLEIKLNIMAELKGDNASRGGWYKTMRETGVFSVNDINELEDRPDVEGGDTRYASLNYVPLNLFEKLSINRNAGQERR